MRDDHCRLLGVAVRGSAGVGIVLDWRTTVRGPNLTRQPVERLGPRGWSLAGSAATPRFTQHRAAAFRGEAVCQNRVGEQRDRGDVICRSQGFEVSEGT